jgi:hypothetical protein
MIDRTRSKLVLLVSLLTALRFFKSLLANERELFSEIFFRDLAIVELLGKIQPTRSVTQSDLNQIRRLALIKACIGLVMA